MENGRKNKFWLMLILVMLLTVGFGTVTVNAATFAGGKGTKTNPYLVSNYSQLKNVRNYYGKYFKQTADIDCENNSIINIFGSFYGVYDGGKHSINNFKCYSSTRKYTYIITEVEKDSVIKNLTFNNGKFKALERTALVGKNSGTLSKVYVTNSTFNAGITYDGVAYAAPLCYYNGGTIQYCKANRCSVKVLSDSWLGASVVAGLVSRNNGLINECKAANMTLGAKSIQYVARVGGIAVYNYAKGKIYGTTLTLAATAYAYGDKNGNYGAYEWGEIGKIVFQNKKGGVVRNCTTEGNFKADVTVKNIRYSDDEVHWIN